MQPTVSFVCDDREAATGRDGARSATVAGGDLSAIPVGNHGDNLQTTYGVPISANNSELLVTVFLSLLAGAMAKPVWDEATWLAIILLEGQKAGAL